MDQSSVEVEVVRSYGGSDATTPSFNRARYVYYFSVHEPFDLKDIVYPERVATASSTAYTGGDEGNYVECGYWDNGYSMSTITTTSVVTVSNPFATFDPDNPVIDTASNRLSFNLTTGFIFRLLQSTVIDRVGLFYPPAASTPFLVWDSRSYGAPLPPRRAAKLDYPATIGYDFALKVPQTIDRLGLVCFSTGLNSAHKITLWDDAGNVVFIATIPSGSYSPIDDFCWISMPGGPFTLQPGRYRIGAYYPVDQAGLSSDAFTADAGPYGTSGDELLSGPGDLYPAPRLSGDMNNIDPFTDEVGPYGWAFICYLGSGDVRPTVRQPFGFELGGVRRIGPNIAFTQSEGFRESHKVTLWKDPELYSGVPTVISTVTIPSGTYAAIDDFYWTSLPGGPLTLTPGSYTIGAYYSKDAVTGTSRDPFRYYDVLSYFAPSGRVVFSLPALAEWYGNASGPGDTYPTYANNSSWGGFGPNISFVTTTTTTQTVNRDEACVPLRIERRIPAALRATLTGVVGAESGTQTLFFSFRTFSPSRIGLLLVRGQRYEDQYIETSLHDDNGPIPVGIDGFARSSLEYPLEFERVTSISLGLGYVECGYWEDGYALNDCLSFATKQVEQDAYGDLDYKFDSPYGAIMPPGQYGFTVSNSQWPKLPYKVLLAIIPPGELSATLECKSDPQARIGLAPLGGVVEMRSDINGVVAGRLSVAAGVVEMTTAPTAMIERVSPYGP